MRKKGRSWGWNLENNDSPILLTLEVNPFAWEISLETYQEVPKKPSGHDQEDSWKEDKALAFVKTLMVNTSIILSSTSTLGVVDIDESQKVGEELWGVELPPYVMGPYSFVGWVEKKLIE